MDTLSANPALRGIASRVVFLFVPTPASSSRHHPAFSAHLLSLTLLVARRGSAGAPQDCESSATSRAGAGNAVARARRNSAVFSNRFRLERQRPLEERTHRLRRVAEVVDSTAARSRCRRRPIDPRSPSDANGFTPVRVSSITTERPTDRRPAPRGIRDRLQAAIRSRLMHARAIHCISLRTDIIAAAPKSQFGLAARCEPDVAWFLSHGGAHRGRACRRSPLPTEPSRARSPAGSGPRSIAPQAFRVRGYRQ